MSKQITEIMIAEYQSSNDTWQELLAMAQQDEAKAKQAATLFGHELPEEVAKRHGVKVFDLDLAVEQARIAELVSRMDDLKGSELAEAATSVWGRSLDEINASLASLVEVIPEKLSIRLVDSALEFYAGRSGSPRYQYYSPCKGTVKLAGKSWQVEVTQDKVIFDGIEFQQGKLSGKGIDPTLSQAVHKRIGYNGTTQRISLLREVFEPLNAKGFESEQQFKDHLAAQHQAQPAQA